MSSTRLTWSRTLASGGVVPPLRGGQRPVAWLLAILIVVGADSTAAHPHAYVVYSLVLPLGPHGVESVGFVFTFDPIFSAVILQDAGQDGPVSGSGSHARILRQLPYEIEITFDGVPVASDPPTGLEVTIAGGQVTYRFLVPLRTPLLPPGTIDIAVDDPGVFAAFALRGSAPVEVRTSGPFTASCERARSASGAPGPIRCQYAGTR